MTIHRGAEQFLNHVVGPSPEKRLREIGLLD